MKKQILKFAICSSQFANKTKRQFAFWLLIAYCLLPTAYCFSQSFQPTVIGSAGTFASSASGSMAWTIGEVMVETYSSVSNSFTQGFHQPGSTLISVDEHSSSQNISVYPNPVANALIVDFANADGAYTLYIYDMTGKKVYEAPILKGANNSTLQGGGQTINISFSNYANGLYLLNIINLESNTITTYKINKSE